MSDSDRRDGRTVLTGIVGDTLQPVTRNIPADEPPELPPNAELRVIGKPVNRVDAVPKVTGKARYTFDVQLPGMLYARIVSSTVPHARIKSIDTSAAEAYPGVKAVHILDRVLSIAQLRDPGVGSERALPARALQRPADRGCRGDEHARGEGCREARAHRIRAPAARHDLEAAMRDDAPVVFPGPTEQAATAGGGGAPPGLPQKGNLRGPARGGLGGGPRGDVQQGFAQADHVDRERISHAGADAHADGNARPRRGLARRGADALRLDAVHAQRARRSGGRVRAAEGKDPRDQRVHRRRLRREVRHRQLRRARDPPVAQGARAGAAGARSTRGARQRRQPAEQPPAPQARREARRHAHGAAGRELRHRRRGRGRRRRLLLTLRCIRSRTCAAEHYDVFTDAGPCAAFRAPGQVQGIFALEQALDELAHEIDMDPLALRDKIDTQRHGRRAGAQGRATRRRRARRLVAAPPRRRGLRSGQTRHRHGAIAVGVHRSRHHDLRSADSAATARSMRSRARRTSAPARAPSWRRRWRKSSDCAPRTWIRASATRAIRPARRRAAAASPARSRRPRATPHTSPRATSPHASRHRSARSRTTSSSRTAACSCAAGRSAA